MKIGDLTQRNFLSKDDPELQLQRLQFREALDLWCHIRAIYDKGDLLDEEYADWELRYPDHINKDETYNYQEDPELQSEVKKLSRKVISSRAGLADGEDSDDVRKPKSKRKPKK